MSTAEQETDLMVATRIPPARRPDLLLRPLGDDGQHVVKDPRTGAYFNLPPQESFLLARLDGQHTVEQLCKAFEVQFSEPLTAEDLDGFIQIVRAQGFLIPDPATAPAEPPRPPKSPLSVARRVLYFRTSFFDPDQLFNWLEPKLRWVWTAAFLWLSLATITLAGGLFWGNWLEYTEYLPQAFRWETVALGWLTLIVVTTCHEFAHGLTCKHYGGECHEVGFLLMFFMPCFYANVSDSWLFREKRKRLLVMLAGTYCDLCVWALAVLAWRVLLPGTMLYHTAWIVMSICGTRVFFNFNPLMKLDGYYMLSDVLEVPNLRRRSYDHVQAHLRWLLWGAPRPVPLFAPFKLLAYGSLSWSFSVTYLSLLFIGLFYVLRNFVGLALAVPVLGIMGWMLFPGLVGGVFAGEVVKMLRYRWWRTAGWVVALSVGLALAVFVPMDDWVSGTFKTRSTVRKEVRAPVPGFLQVVHFDEGETVESGQLVGMLEIPDLPSKLAQKRAELTETEAKLKLLVAGTRPEQLAEQRDKVKRATTWRDRAEQDLALRRAALKEELHRLGRAVAKAKTQVNYSLIAYEQARKLLKDNALPQEQFRDAEKLHLMATDELSQAEAQKRERETVGTVEQESELAKRQKELSDEQAALNLMEAGSRPEEIDAERARLARLQHEKAYLENLQEKLRLISPVRGLVVTPYLREKIGQYFREGDLICEIEDPLSLEIEVPLDEQDVRRIETKMDVLLKPRALPLQSCEAEVERIAPQAVAGKVQSTVNVYCKLKEPVPELLSGMTGYARIYCGRTCLVGYLGGRALRYFRTEIWW